MPRKEILKLLAGFRRFRQRYFENNNGLYTRLSSIGQKPKTLIIGCSDSRVDPALISGAAPGDLFVVRNVANLVPPFDPNGGVHGVSAAIEFAVVNLKVENIMILGHRQCGGIRALMVHNEDQQSGFIGPWVRIATPAKERVLARFPKADEETLCRHAEQESIVTSLANLRTFPFVQKAIDEGRLTLMGIYFDLESGHLLEVVEETGEFQEIEVPMK